ncbi:hypothetical protein LGQ02_19105 [Bacillus shivajii]|uniref:hypothetical protein n=1 Tax=Bacillus shivajii TaxID=1983719 RepID=UPI001CFAE906|nr:hypothetical protein [Bacillus shivajii]UCZ52864.1 hypothetical protein LGQ02_19105 [Bacillus shivajii]
MEKKRGIGKLNGRNVRLNLQAKLTIMIVILIFVITSLSATASEIAQHYIQNVLAVNIVTTGVSILLGALGAYVIIRFILKKQLLMGLLNKQIY